ncbi:hypothetical protein RSOLAG1IB_07046 [Rhizoctonia solani AG-1 IB]|uniref:Uncharacterized protein n=1 Tax=Thanatephorus cucumeris (strain AG1-IB / isolate 7/3/14) TaxID=1108050 RepID=A0A0B7FE35_THACB|nr:hypothetical protein RSOLAG1IB_07046 [Rhizoctonia solani AG-1 IB]
MLKEATFLTRKKRATLNVTPTNTANSCAAVVLRKPPHGVAAAGSKAFQCSNYLPFTPVILWVSSTSDCDHLSSSQPCRSTPCPSRLPPRLPPSIYIAALKQ